MDIVFQAEPPYKLASAILHSSVDRLSINFNPQTRVVSTTEPALERMLKRLIENKSVVLPFFEAKTSSCLWMVLANTPRELDQIINHVKPLIIPTYGNFTATDGPKQFHITDSDDDFQIIGKQLYPAGYYTWHSPVENKVTRLILERLNLWLDLEESRPTIQVVQRKGYTELYNAFTTALATSDWLVADLYLQEIQRLGLGTAENLAFLKIRLLAQQQRWDDIWKFKDFAKLARLKVPRPIRADLLSAFYYSQLQPQEQQHGWQAALTAFKADQPKLGLLLTSRVELTLPAVLRVFAYQALASEDATSLKRLIEINPDEETLAILNELTKLLSAQSLEDTTESSQVEDEFEDYVEPTYLVRQALQNKDYDKALELTGKVTRQGERVLLRLQIADERSDALLASQEITVFQALPTKFQALFQENDPTLQKRLARLQQLVDPKVATTTQLVPEITIVSIRNWLEWFDRMMANPDDPELSIALERLNNVTDERLWTLETIAVFNHKLQNLVDNIRPYAKLAIQYLSNFFLLDSEFPRSASVYADLYDTLYICLMMVGNHTPTTGKALLRLAEAQLNVTPQKWQTYHDDFTQWCVDQPSQTPIAKLEEWVLEALELVLDYGAPPAMLGKWYRQWVNYLLQKSGGRTLPNLELWRELGEFIVSGDNLLKQLEANINEEGSQQLNDPITLLQTGYQIGIFSLREGSAKRVESLINKRNPAVKVKICTESDLNDSAKSIAQNSNMVIVVTSCISHAMTYGIGPFLKAQNKEPVYPQSSGSTSIIRAIENSFHRS